MRKKILNLIYPNVIFTNKIKKLRYVRLAWMLDCYVNEPGNPYADELNKSIDSLRKKLLGVKWVKPEEFNEIKKQL